MPKFTGSIIYRTTVIATAVAFIIISSWISVPLTVGVTMQTFAIFLVSVCFNAKISLSAVAIYILLGFFGVPVYSGFGTGISAFMGGTGGYIIAFLPSALIISCLRSLYVMRPRLCIVTMILSNLVCYLFGALWYKFVFLSGAEISLSAVFAICVFPFILPDLAKILCVYFAFKRIEPYVCRINRRLGGSL